MKSNVMKIYRTDLLPSNLTQSKKIKILDMLFAYRKGAVLIGREQWKLFFQTGEINKFHNGDKITLKSVIGNSGRVQMCRHQVVAQLQGWISNRANEFTSCVNSSTLSDDKKIGSIYYSICNESV